MLNSRPGSCRLFRVPLSMTNSSISSQYIPHALLVTDIIWSCIFWVSVSLRSIKLPLGLCEKVKKKDSERHENQCFIVILGEIMYLYASWVQYYLHARPADNFRLVPSLWVKGLGVRMGRRGLSSPVVCVDRSVPLNKVNTELCLPNNLQDILNYCVEIKGSVAPLCSVSVQISTVSIYTV